MVSTENRLQRRGLSKSAGLAIVGIGAGLKLTKPAEAGHIEHDKLHEKIERLEPQEREALVTLLQGIWELDIDRMITPATVNWWLKLTRLNVQMQSQDEKEKKKSQEELAHRESLLGLEKLEYIVSQLTEQLQTCTPGFLREILDRVLGGEMGIGRPGRRQVRNG